MSETLNAIEERLSPAHLRAQMMAQVEMGRDAIKLQLKEDVSELKRAVRDEVNDAKAALRAATIGKVENMLQNASDTMGEVRSTVFNTIRENPIPAALVGVGLVWLLMNGTSSGRRASGRARALGGDAAIKVRDVAEAAGHKAATLAHEAGATAEGYAHRAADAATTLATKTKDGALYVEERFEHTMQENPLAVGAFALALGTAVGLMLPSSAREDEWMGGARDRLVAKAENAAHGAVTAAEATMSQAIGAAKLPTQRAEAPNATQTR